jgi:hypothetical protein
MPRDLKAEIIAALLIISVSLALMQAWFFSGACMGVALMMMTEKNNNIRR